MQLVTLAYICLIALASFTTAQSTYQFDVQCSRSNTCGSSWGIQLIGAAGGAGTGSGLPLLNPNITCNQGDILNFIVSQDATNYPFAVQTMDAMNVQTIDGGQNPISTAGILSVQCQNGFYLSPSNPTMSGFIVANVGVVQGLQQQQATLVVAAQPVTVQEKVFTSNAQAVPVVQQVPVPVVQTVERVKIQPVNVVQQVPVPVVQTIVQEKIIKQPVIQPVIQQVTPEPSMVSFTEAPYTIAPFTQAPYTVAVPVTTQTQATVTPVVNTVVTPYVTQPQTACAQTTIPGQVVTTEPAKAGAVLPITAAPLVPAQPVAEATQQPIFPIQQQQIYPGQQQQQPGPFRSSASSMKSSILLSILPIVFVFNMLF
jgi:hypothetical protein